ncbi:putative Serine/threonine-protein kinase Pkn1 [Pillotina sp. SPG140]
MRCNNCGKFIADKFNFCPHCGIRQERGFLMESEERIIEITTKTCQEQKHVEAMGFVLIKAGIFIMGSPEHEQERRDDEVQHQVTISKDFYIGKYPVTQKEWIEVMGNNPSKFRGYNLPVEHVPWSAAISYCNKRSQREGLSLSYTVKKDKSVIWNKNADGYRLPTEAEWEYACRAGTTTAFSTGENITTDQANYSGERTTPVGTFNPNPWGLYDIHGNVWEWCWDWYGEYDNAPQIDPTGTSTGCDRVSRGGSWSYNAGYLRSACRGRVTSSYRFIPLGFRLVRPIL